MITPEKLERGDAIGVIALSSPGLLSYDRKDKGRLFLESKGLIVREAENIEKVDSSRRGIKMKIDALNAFLLDPNIKAIMSFWGGYTTNQVLPEIDYDLIRANPKIIIGYSDFDAALNAITKKSGVVTYCGPAFVTFTKPDVPKYTWESFEDNCFQSRRVRITPADAYTDDIRYIEDENIPREMHPSTGHKVFRPGATSGEILVSNMTTLASLQGTEFAPNPRNKVLFLEAGEISSSASIYRDLSHLDQSCVFKKAAGVVLGIFPKQCGFSKNDNSLETLLETIFGRYDFPIVYNVNFGHTDPILTIPNGGNCDLDTRSMEISFY